MNPEITKQWTREAGWPEGLYRRSTGNYYTRYRLNGTRSAQSHETDVFTVAKLKHAKFVAKLEEERQSGATTAADFRCLGACATEFESRLVASTIGDSTKVNYRNWLARLKGNWPLALGTEFETAQVRNVDLRQVAKLREHLAGHATYKIVNTRKPRKGYSPAVVNQTLDVLRMLLNIAREEDAIPVNPFDERGVLQEAIYLPRGNRKKELPSRTDMERVFAEMERVPNAENYTGELAGRLEFLQQQARDAAEHARFLAYSGMRLQEGNASELSDDRGKTMDVRGTKTKTSLRTIPVTPELRRLLDTIKGRRIGGNFLAVQSSLQAMQRACKRLGLARLTHHHLRHYFATICIESGVPIPTVADWLGHTDGGALLMKTYRHLLQEHSIAAAQKVVFKSEAVA